MHKFLGEQQCFFLQENIDPTAKRVGANLLIVASPYIVEVVSGRKNFKTAAKNVGGQNLRKHLGSGSRERTASKVIKTKNLQN